MAISFGAVGANWSNQPSIAPSYKCRMAAQRALCCGEFLWLKKDLIGCFLPILYFMSIEVAINLLGCHGDPVMKDDVERSIAMEVGAAFRARRLRAGLSQDQLSELLGVGPEAVSRMERGVVMLTILRLVELSNLLDCPVEAFIPRVSGSTQSGANEIARMLKPLNKKDMQFVMDILERTCAHLAS